MIMRWFLLLLLVIGTAALCLLAIKTPLNIYDEGLALVGGWRLLQGDIPFRDYWALYPPGQSYLLAMIFKLAGANILVERLYDVTVRALCVAAVFPVAQMLMPSLLLTCITTLTVGLLLAAATFYGYIMFPALLLAFLACYAFFRALARPTSLRFFVVGLALGLTALFRVDVAGYAGIAVLGSLLLQPWQGDQQHAAHDVAAPTFSWWRQTLLIGGGATLVAVPIYGYLTAVSNPSEIFTNLLIFPTTTFRAVRHLPYPSLLPDWSRWTERGNWLSQVDWVIGDWARFYLPLLVYGLTTLLLLIRLIRARQRREAVTRNTGAGAAMLLFGLGLFLQALSRYDAIHALPTALATILLIGWLWQQLLAAHWWRPIYTPVPLLLTLLPLFVYAYLPYAQLRDYATVFPPTGCYATLPRAGCVPISQDQASIINWLDQLDPTGKDAVFVAARRHDQLFINDVSLYFLAGRPIPTRYHELHPGVATTAIVQKAIIAELTRAAVPWLFVVHYPDSHEPNDSAKSSGVILLDEYIHANYHAVQQYGIYQLWQRQATP